MAKMDAVRNVGSLEQGNVDHVLQKLRDDPGLGDETRTKLGAEMGDTIKEMYGIEPHEVKMMNGLPQHTRDTIMHLCAHVTNHPHGRLTYERGTGGPRFEYEFREVATPNANGGDHDTHPELHFRCLK